MPSYIGFRPQFNPVSLQDYLAVPTMLINEQEKQLDKIENYKNEAEKYRAIMGNSPEAQAIWAAYDSALGNLGDDMINKNVGDLVKGVKKVGDSFRAIKYKAESAQERRNADVERFLKDPSLIGDVPNIMTYYNDPNYRAVGLSTKDMESKIGPITDAYAKSFGPVDTGKYLGDPKNKQTLVESGISPDKMNESYNNAIKRNPKTAYEETLVSYLDGIGYYNAPDAIKRKVEQQLYSTMNEHSGYALSVNDGLKAEATRVKIEGDRLDNTTRRETLKATEPKSYVRYDKDKKGNIVGGWKYIATPTKDGWRITKTQVDTKGKEIANTTVVSDKYYYGENETDYWDAPKGMLNPEKDKKPLDPIDTVVTIHSGNGSNKTIEGLISNIVSDESNWEMTYSDQVGKQAPSGKVFIHNKKEDTYYLVSEKAYNYYMQPNISDLSSLENATEV